MAVTVRRYTCRIDVSDIHPTVMCLHGYGSRARAFDAWRTALTGIDARAFHAVQYRVDSNEVDLVDLAEALERTVETNHRMREARPLHVLVHSTGMLVLIAWLARHPERASMIGWVVALAPASHGSPLAHLGRGMLAALVNGSLAPGPDTLEGGDRLLRSLELASADVDPFLHGVPPIDPSRLIVVSGTARYPFPRNVVHEEGGDGVVRLAGAHPIPIRIEADLTKRPRHGRRLFAQDPMHVTPKAIPVWPLPDRHHGSILTQPPQHLVDVVAAAFTGAWSHGQVVRRVRRHVAATLHRGEPGVQDWTQLIVQVEDERGNPVSDYYVDLLVREGAPPEQMHAISRDRRTGRSHATWRSIAVHEPQVPIRVHVNRADRSRRCFHLDLTRLDRTEFSVRNARHGLAARKRPTYRFAIRIAARTGSDLVGYRGHHEDLPSDDPRDPGLWTATVDLTPALEATRALRPGTTTHLRIRLDREPLPFGAPSPLAHLPRDRKPDSR